MRYFSLFRELFYMICSLYFVYKDNFHDNIKNYLEISGQVDSSGNKISTNSDASGRYHSSWLNMIFYLSSNATSITFSKYIDSLFVYFLLAAHLQCNPVILMRSLQFKLTLKLVLIYIY